MIDLSRVPVVVYRAPKASSSFAFAARSLMPIPRYHYHGKGGGWGDYSMSESTMIGIGSTPEEAVQNLRKNIFEALSTLPDADFTEIDMSDYRAHVVHSG